MDLGQPDSAENLYERCQHEGKNIDVLINNAGFGLYGEHLQLDAERLHNMLNLNMNTLAMSCYWFGKQMKSRGSGTIINIGSTASFQPLPFMAAYAASKAFVVSFSHSLREELAPHGIKVICVCPGTTKTAFLKEAGLHENQAFGTLDYLAYKVAMNPEKVADTVFEAYSKGNAFAVPGLANKTHYLASRWLPKKALNPIVSTIFQKPGNGT